MLILATDTSTPYLSIALCEDTKVLAEVSIFANRKHSEKLLFYIDQLLNETNTLLTDINLLAVAHGPGSFTGVRVGVSAIKGLAAGAHIPVIGISTLDALARRAESVNGTVCVLLDAKMNEVYASLYQYESGQRTIQHNPVVAPINTVLKHCSKDTVFLGDGTSVYREEIISTFPTAHILPDSYMFPGAVSVAAEAHALVLADFDNTKTNVAPIYLRKSQAEVIRDQKQKTVSTS